MTPFQQFRVWLRQGPSKQRAAAGVAVLVALGLLAWAIVPSNQPSTPTLVGQPPALGQPTVGTATGPPLPGATGVPVLPTAGATAIASAPTPGGSVSPRVTAPSGGPVPSGRTNPCDVPLRATDQGVTAREIFVAVPYINLAGEAGNSTFGIRSPAEYAKLIQAHADGINAEGGVACRKLRVRSWDVNSLDPVDQQRKCQQIVAAKPFAVVDAGGYLTPSAQDCFLRAKLPYQAAVNMSQQQALSAYPYRYTGRASVDRAVRNWVFEAPARGWFDAKKGFRKLGIVMDNCYPEVFAQLISDLHRVGVSDQEMSVFRLSGCFAINPPSEISAAVAQHRNDGATHVFLAGNGSNDPTYVRQADGIGWKPVYLTSDYGQDTEPTFAKNWPEGFDGAVAITGLRAGERNSNISSPWVARCNAHLKKAGVKPSQSEADQAPLSFCDQLRLFAYAANSAGPNLVRSSLIPQGLVKVGRFEGAMSPALNDWDHPRELYSGDYIRAIGWHASCTCWKVVDRNFKPGH